MRTAGLPNFRKLYAAYNDGLTAGKYRLVIQNSYNVKQINGTKKFALATTNALGGSNYFLSWAYIIVGLASIAFSAVFAFFYKKQNK